MLRLAAALIFPINFSDKVEYFIKCVFMGGVTSVDANATMVA